MGDMANELGSHLKILLIHRLQYDYQKRILKDPWVEEKVLHIWLSSINTMIFQSRPARISRDLVGKKPFHARSVAC